MDAIVTPQGQFTAEVAGPADGPLVLLLHGFPQSRHAWRHQVPALAAAGYRAVAFDQRGYSPGVRPDPLLDLSAYAVERLTADVLDVAERLAGAKPFHLAGHDWGGQVAWVVAGRHPERLASLTVLSRPHPAAFRRALNEDADSQQYRSRHHRNFRDPTTAQRWLENDACLLRRKLADNHVPPAAIAEYLSVLGEPAALEAAIAWYRAAGALTDIEAGTVRVPTLYVWGDGDSTVGPSAARWTADYVAAPLRFEILPEVGHFITDEVPEIVTSLMVEHITACEANRGANAAPDQ